MILTQERLKKLLHYDPETGLFTRIKRTSKSTHVGEIVGQISSNGYIKLSIDYKEYYVHRLSFLYMLNIIPDHVDHIDGIKINNKWKNLRDGTRAQNYQNIKVARITNITGLLGAHFDKRDGTFYSRITLNRKQKYLGNFKTAEEAHQAYLNAKRQIHEFNTL